MWVLAYFCWLWFKWKFDFYRFCGIILVCLVYLLRSHRFLLMCLISQKRFAQTCHCLSEGGSQWDSPPVSLNPHWPGVSGKEECVGSVSQRSFLKLNVCGDLSPISGSVFHYQCLWVRVESLGSIGTKSFPDQAACCSRVSFVCCLPTSVFLGGQGESQAWWGRIVPPWATYFYLGYYDIVRVFRLANKWRFGVRVAHSERVLKLCVLS